MARKIERQDVELRNDGAHHRSTQFGSGRDMCDSDIIIIIKILFLLKLHTKKGGQHTETTHRP